MAGFGQLTAHHWCYLGSQQFDGLGHFGKGHTPDVDLPDEALVSKQFVLVQHFVDDLLRASDEERIFFPCFPGISRYLFGFIDVMERLMCKFRPPGGMFTRHYNPLLHRSSKT